MRISRQIPNKFENIKRSELGAYSETSGSLDPVPFIRRSTYINSGILLSRDRLTGLYLPENVLVE
jgi:hypothetical protein